MAVLTLVGVAVGFFVAVVVARGADVDVDGCGDLLHESSGVLGAGLDGTEGVDLPTVGALDPLTECVAAADVLALPPIWT